SIDLDIGTLRFADRTFNDLRITGKRIKNNLQLDLVGPQVKGGMLLASSERGDESINARFEFLKLAPDQPSISTPVAAESGEHRKRIPAALNVIVESFEFEGKSLGRLELLAAPEKTGWRLERLAIANPDGRIDVRGNWSVTGRPHAEYAVRFEASDTGKFLARLGYAEAVVGGTASLTGPVSWLGGPFKPDLPTLTGKLKLEVAVGRFAQVDPGAGQLIGLLSLQALPRRITLNFNDVFSSGFSFDRIEADVVVTEGLAQTDNFRMEGPAAEVTMRGEVNLVTETQNVDVRVKPMLSTAAAVAGAAVINPLVGVATLLVQKALGDPVEEAASRYYRVTGTWGDPQIERIKRPASQDKASAAGR
ncbi:MAG: TIGR02099 family protein, partial [Burkholderiales bacterium]|nr:TIGR02099 family protein [Burkholderiales bacterium]